MSTDIKEPTPDVKALEKALERLNASRFIRMYNSLPQLLAVNFLKGLAIGFGTVVGATILVSIVALSLSNIDFIPIVGEWAAKIANQMESSR